MDSEEFKAYQIKLVETGKQKAILEKKLSDREFHILDEMRILVKLILLSDEQERLVKQSHTVSLGGKNNNPKNN